MKHKFLFALLIPITLLAAVALANGKRTATAAYILAHYPKSRAFTFFTQPLQTTAKPQQIFRSVWFLGGNPRVGMQCDVDANGRIATERNVYEWADQTERHWQLTPAQLKSLNASLHHLPANAVKPALKDLLVVHFIERGQAATRIYNRTKLPPEIARLYQTIDTPYYSGDPDIMPKGTVRMAP